jgi:hypothetical protein
MSTMKAPAAFARFVALSNTVYTADASANIANVTPNDVIDLLKGGCTILPDANALNNFAATSAPGVGDDSADGYGIGSRWLNTTTDSEYICVDATEGAAVWIKSVSEGSSALAAAEFGAVNAPASGTVAVALERIGKFFTMTFTLTLARITVTDGGGSGSHGSLKLFDFVQQGLQFLACRQNYTAFAEGAALTGAAGDAAFVLGVGTAAVAAAADGALATTSVDIGSSTSTITLSGGTGTGTKHNASTANVDGTSTAGDIYLNWSGSAATIDATSTIDVTGTITIAGVMLGDDA